MILSFVIPELIFGVAMFFVFTKLFTTVDLGSLAEVLALVTWNLSWPAIIVQARLVTLGRQYEEAAADLGANRWQIICRVMMPLLGPGHLRERGTGLLRRDRRLRHRRPALLQRQQHPDVGVSSTPPSTAATAAPRSTRSARSCLVMSFIIAIIGYIGYRWFTRGERGSRTRGPDHHRREEKARTRPAVSFLSRTELVRAPA